jgi:peptidyl-prolyl cis-trans isomerase SurA
VAVAGACVLLAACSPVKAGAAAVVGSQRITTASLDAQVSSVQAAAKHYGVPVQTSGATLPQVVLGWLISFDIRDRMARDAGVTVTDAQIRSALAELDQSQAQVAATNGVRYPGLDALLAEAGISPQMKNDLGRYEAQLVAYVTKANGNQLPTTQTEANQLVAQAMVADCHAQKALGIQVNPRFGQLSFDTNRELYAVVDVGDTLSRPGGQAPSPTVTPPLPAC